MTQNKRPFTLIEVILVMGVIALVFASIGIAIPSALKKERFEKGVVLVQERLQTAIEIMLDYDTDLYLLFEPKKGGVNCIYKTAKPLPEKAVKSLSLHTFIPDITAVYSHSGPLYFSAADCRVPQGVVTIVGEKNVEITSPGYPARMKKGIHEIKNIKAPYPQEIRQEAFSSS